MSEPGPEIVAAGRISVDLYPEQAGPIADVRTFAKSLGGTATNVAVAAARLGRRVAVVTKVGDDPLGEYAIGALQQFGVDTRLVGRTAELLTPIVLAELDPPEDPALFFYRRPTAPDLQLTAGDIDAATLARAAILWTTGTGLSEQPSRDATLAWMRSHGARRDEAGHVATVLDLDWRPMFWRHPEEATEVYGQALAHATVAVGNRAEVEVAVGTADPHEAADRLLERGVRLAIVKCGADGALVATAGRRGRSGVDGQPAARTMVAPLPVEVVCGLGAGDAFGGALCHGLLAGWPAVRCVELANAAGAIVASRLACADAMPTQSELDAALEGARG